MISATKNQSRSSVGHKRERILAPGDCKMQASRQRQHRGVLGEDECDDAAGILRGEPRRLAGVPFLSHAATLTLIADNHSEFTIGGA